MQPLIGITPDTNDSEYPQTEYVVRRNYADAIIEAGGIPLILPYVDDVSRYCDVLDGVLITGSMFEIHPVLFGCKTDRPDIPTKPERTDFETKLAKLVLEKEIPYLGICNGMQILAVCLGGKLVQNIPDEIVGYIEHSSPSQEPSTYHEISIHPDTSLRSILVADRVTVNSIHRQAVKTHRSYMVGAVASDGVIEAIEVPGRPFCLGVQWHPEYYSNPADRNIWVRFIEEASRHAERRSTG